jgi:hypothetical protein
MVTNLAGMTAEPWYSPSETCRICTERSEPDSTAFLCQRCRRIYRQGGPGVKKKEARYRAMRKQWNGEEKAFLCHFSHLPLTDVPGSRISATWEHLTPGDEWSVVLAADLVNKMKGHMTETQFEKMVLALADHFQNKKPFNPKAFPADVSPLDRTDHSEPEASSD